MSDAACAQDMIDDGLNSDFAPIEQPSSENAAKFKNGNEELGKIKEPAPVKCNDEQLYVKVMEVVNDYAKTLKADSTLMKRKKALLTANINGFHKVPTEGFNTAIDFNTTNALLMIKINEKILEKDILVCKQNGKREPSIFLIIYPFADNYKVYVLNLDTFSDDYRDISFMYP